jgi:hypothetical protein
LDLGSSDRQRPEPGGGDVPSDSPPLAISILDCLWSVLLLDLLGEKAQLLGQT